MRTMLMALALVALTAQAHAQGVRRPETSNAQEKGEDRQKRMAREEAAARAAMKNVPESKEKYDPWKIGK